ncbi:ammonium transporter [Marinomonas agarivorans]|nr:ammonium transporter [Marinomonas agarivorans]
MTVADVQANLDIIWILIAASMVLLMQAGFTALESGVTRAKNTINVAMKNITDFIASVLIFFFVGYSLMFGSSVFGGLFGFDGFALANLSTPMDYAGFVFQATFAGTAATIISGAVAERMRFFSYVIVSVIVVALIYPISGHWIWAADGWLAEAQMVDFAGSTVVHSLGAWVGLAGALVLGPRLGRFDENGKPNKIHGHSLVFAVMGVLVLFFGWFGFNGGSTLAANSSVAIILANTILAASAGGMSCFVVSMFASRGEVQIEKLLNGVIGGLVAVTAGCAVLEPSGAALLGLFAGVIVYYAEEIILHVFKIDDPVNVIAAHGVAGAWGTLALAFFAPAANLPLGNAFDQFLVQAQGVFAVMAWGLGTGFVLFKLLSILNVLRVSPEAENMGLNVHEHGATSGLMETMNTMKNIVAANNGNGESDLTKRVAVESGTQEGDVAYLFNELIRAFHNTILEIKNSSLEISDAARVMQKTSQELDSDAESQRHHIGEITESISSMSGTFNEVVTNTTQTAEATKQAANQIDEMQNAMTYTFSSVKKLANGIDDSHRVINELLEQNDAISSILETINGISEQTNLLALNAAIEAARAGEAGRGFSVVADEVRLLSQKTSESTHTIKSLIDRLQESSEKAAISMNTSKEVAGDTVIKTEETSKNLTSVGKMIQNIDAMTNVIAAMTEQQSNASNEIAEKMQDIESLTNNATNRAATAYKTSDMLSHLSNKLDVQVSGMKVSERNLLH